MLNNKIKGYLMIEVLILLIIFASLGITLYQLSMKSNTAANNSNYRAIALQIANEAFDKMKSNQSATLAGLYLTYSGGVTVGSFADNNCKAVNYNVTHTEATCNYSKMATDDLIEMQRSVQGLLPQGQIFICKDSARSLGNPTNPNCDDAGNDYVVKIFWKDRTSKDINQNNGFSQVVMGGSS
jgi:type IV pilus modification protein PilV